MGVVGDYMGRVRRIEKRSVELSSVTDSVMPQDRIYSLFKQFSHCPVDVFVFWSVTSLL